MNNHPPVKPSGMTLDEWLVHPDFVAWHESRVHDEIMPISVDRRNHIQARTMLWLAGCSYRQIALFFHGSRKLTREAVRNSVRRGKGKKQYTQLRDSLTDAEAVDYCDIAMKHGHLYFLPPVEAAKEIIKLGLLSQDSL